MNKLVILSLVFGLIGCGSEPVEEVNEHKNVVESAPVETVDTEQKEKPISSLAASKKDAENYVLMVESALTDAKKFNPDTEMDSFKKIQERFVKLRDGGEKFRGTDFHNCMGIGIFPFEVLWLRKQRDSLKESLGLYDRYYQACQREINEAQ